MKETRFFYVPDAAKENELPMEEALHALRVLRLKSGDEMFLMDGVGTFFKSRVTIAATKRCMYEITETLPQEKAWHGRIHLVVAPTKIMDKVEWLCEKATELGVDDIAFINCKFSERKVMRTVRLEKIVIAAMKQSRKPWKPEINPMISFREFITSARSGRKFIAHCYNEIERKDFFESIYPMAQSNDDEEITILIGPEGDFSIDEVKLAMKHGYESVSLGKARLRTETAAVAAVNMAQLALRNK